MSRSAAAAVRPIENPNSFLTGSTGVRLRDGRVTSQYIISWDLGRGLYRQPEDRHHVHGPVLRRPGRFPEIQLRAGQREPRGRSPRIAGFNISLGARRAGHHLELLRRLRRNGYGEDKCARSSSPAPPASPAAIWRNASPRHPVSSAGHATLRRRVSCRQPNGSRSTSSTVEHVRSAVAALRPARIYHLAGVPHVAGSWDATAPTLAGNVLATHYLFDACGAPASGARARHRVGHRVCPVGSPHRRGRRHRARQPVRAEQARPGDAHAARHSRRRSRRGARAPVQPHGRSPGARRLRHRASRGRSRRSSAASRRP
jgi:hypothetical protein